MTTAPWIGEPREADLTDFGQPVINFEEEDLPSDAGLASALGWKKVLTDEDNKPFKLDGIVEQKGESFAVFSFWQNLAMDKDYRYSVAMLLTATQTTAVREWAEAALATRREEANKRAERIAELMRDNGLDKRSVQMKRSRLLYRHGLI